MYNESGNSHQQIKNLLAENKQLQTLGEKIAALVEEWQSLNKLQKWAKATFYLSQILKVLADFYGSRKK